MDMYQKSVPAVMENLSDAERKDEKYHSGEVVSPFSLLGNRPDITAICQELSIQYDLNANLIEDIYPCTPMQEGLLSLTSLRPRDYVLCAILELAPQICLEKFRVSWEDIVRKSAILRTRIVQHHELGLLQVVLTEETQWVHAEDLEEYIGQQGHLDMSFGHRLSRYVIINNSTDGKRYFIWYCHHALYDGQFLFQVSENLSCLCSGQAIKKQPQFNTFIKYVLGQDNDSALRHWKSALHGYEAQPFPTLSRTTPETTRYFKIEHRCPQLPRRNWPIRRSTIVYAAWAIVAGIHGSTDDVVFGTICSGRKNTLLGAEQIAGPTISNVPVRVKIISGERVWTFLERIQHEGSKRSRYEQAGLQNIAKIDDCTRHACSFETLLVIQPTENDLHMNPDVGVWKTGSKEQVTGTYGLSVQCFILEDGIKVVAHSDTRFLEEWRLKNLLEQFTFVMQQLADARPEQSLAEIETLTPTDRQLLWAWNNSVPVAIERPVHELIMERAQSQPNAPAVCAWDGNLTYGEMDQMSTRIARHLVGLGIGADSIVPLCFEKSQWTSIAILAVLKAGGAFILLDPSQPEIRLRSIIEHTKARIVLSSVAYRHLASRLLDNVVVISADFTRQSNTPSLHLPSVCPSSMMYVVFTSGSTGTPKGVMIHHSAFSSAVHYQSSCLGLEPTSRVLDFAAYSFDIAIRNAIATFIVGGCLCVPSDQSRKDDLTKCMSSMQVNTAHFTPSVARTLRPTDLPELEKLFLGGEAVQNSDVSRWSNNTQVVIGYGPAECTPTSTINARANESVLIPTLGKGVGAVTWVVNPANHDTLLPVGVIGELLLEGPIVGRGYLNDPEKTATAFIVDPPWLLQGTEGNAGRRGRLYKTGDLVCYNEDGSLTFIGRKDTQVKIRGQRVELGEVERHMRDCLTDASQLAAEVIIPGGDGSSAVLAVFTTNDSGQQSRRENELVRVVPMSTEIENKLEERLPSYMVPNVMFVMAQLPMTSTGKTDRKRLREIGASFSTKQLADLCSAVRGQKRRPNTEIERTLQRVWARVLNLDVTSIGLDDSFFRLGGDSITAMQVSSATRSAGFNISTGDILRKKTIWRLVSGLQRQGIPSTLQISSEREMVQQAFGLSPIQKFYFHLQHHESAHFDQCFLLQVARKVSSASLVGALRVLTQIHSMLRARFGKSNEGIWEQYITNDVTGSFHVKYMRDTTQKEMVQTIIRSRESLDIKRGPLFVAVLFDNADSQLLFLTIHHLVIDLVSWRVVLQDLEDLLISRALPVAPSVSFQTWCSLQADYTRMCLNKEASLPFTIRPSLLSYWGRDSAALLRGAVATKSFVLDQHLTSALLTSCNDAFQTRPVELMMAALIYSFGLVFTDRELPPVFCEAHGREVWDDSIDVSRTIGWFTTMFPVQVSIGVHDSLIHTIRQVKDCIASLPYNGWSYFTSTLLSPSEANSFPREFPAEIAFNYTGLYQQLERSDALFRNIPLPDECEAGQGVQSRRFAVFNIHIGVDDGHIMVSFLYPRDLQREQSIALWVNRYQTTLAEMVSLLLDRPFDWTLSDFPRTFGSYDDLREFKDISLPALGILDPADLEDVFPCSPMQEGILFSQARDPDTYQSCLFFKVIPPMGNDRVDTARLKLSWEAVVRRHPLLRAILLEVLPGYSGPANVVLKHPVPNISFIRIDDDKSINPARFRKLYNSGVRQKAGLQHHLWICQHGEEVYMCLEINHAISDGFSTEIILGDLQAAYAGQLDQQMAVSYRDFVFHLQCQSSVEACDFWMEHLCHVEPCHFPILGNLVGREDITRSVKVPDLDSTMIHRFSAQWEVTPSTIVQTAWAIVLRWYTGVRAPCFGNLTAGRDLHIRHSDEIVGPLIGMLTCYICLKGPKTVLDVMQEVQEKFIKSLSYQTFPLAKIQKSLGHSSALFNTVVSLQRTGGKENYGSDTIRFSHKEWYDPTEYDVTVNATDNGKDFAIQLSFKSKHLALDKGEILADFLATTIYAIIDNPHKMIGELDPVSRRDIRDLWDWNGSVPATIEQCVHELVEEKARSQPNAPAVCAWDGDLTYGEISELSNRLARRLVQHGVGPGLVVPLCFEKSRWISVAILAVLKAGGAFVLLDPSQPESRLQSITQQIQAQLVLSSVQHHGLASRLAGNVIVVSPGCIALRSYTSHVALPSVSPSSTMYIVFTSGSTGTPKGVLIHHSAFSSATHYQSNYLKLSPTSRVLDFATYGFDVAISNILMTLIAGGCLCVPSDQSRRDNLTESMISMRVNTAHFTPSIARTLEPSDLPELQVLWIGGEAVQRDDVRDWLDHTAMINAYGPAECTPFSTINTQGTEPSLVPRIGRGAGAVTWVVDAEDHNVLLPIGVTGELLLEGPIVGRGYLNDPEKNATAFIIDPPWLLQGTEENAGRRGRLYKTGDLVRYNEDGSLTFIGRKDTQVKIRGQRVELGEVEHHVQQCMPQTRQLAAEVIVPNGEGATGILAVFIVVDPLAGEEEPLAINKPSVAAKVIPIPSGVEAELAEHLPSYMVPDVFFSIAYLPITSTGKTDRKLLREIGASFSAQRLRELRATPVEKRQPTTETERKLQDLWARVLQIDPSTIGLDDHFFRLGGDSILAMRLVAECRRAGMALSVNDIFRQPKLAGLAQRLVIQNNPIECLSPFLLLGDSVDARAYCQEISENYQLDSALIEDIYPCTPLQEGLLALTSKNAGGYMLRNVLELSANINISRFCNAWEQSVLSTPILRTRIVQHSKLGLLQVVYNEKPKWVKSGQLQEYTHHDKSISMGLGQPLVRYGLVHDKEKKQHWFIWTIHHALYDGESLSLILDMVHQVYYGLPIQQQPQFNLFVQHLLQKSTSTTTAYWQSLFSNYQSSSFPPLPPQIQEPIADMTLKYQCSLPMKQSDITTATLVRAAWALVASHHTSSPDVVFGATVSGRNATVAGIEEIVGPTIATVPIRVQIHRQQTVSAYLHKIQESAIDMIPYEQTGLQHISKISKEAQEACNFQTLLVIQPPDTLSVDDHFGSWSIDIDTRAFSTYALTLNCFLTRDIIEIVASFDSRVIDVWVMQKVLEDFSFTMQQLAEFRPDQMLSEINILTPTDRGTLWGWNSSVPATIEQCVHELVEERARSQPNAPAVCAWDGDLTYGEVNELSNRLAHQLVQHGVGPGLVVPLCFEKSRWISVAILAVLKAGGAFVLLDPSQPKPRLQSITQQIQAQLVLSSVQHHGLASRLAGNVIVVSPGCIALRSYTSHVALPSVSPSSTMYIVFTSGSTGTPKGVLIHHSAFSSATHYQSNYLKLSPTSRVLDFATYGFDVAISNILMTLIAGGCLCVPSDQSRRDNLTESMISMRVNTAHFTPSIARTLEPSDLPELQVLWIGGEAVQRDDARDWLDHTAMINAYGPAECTPFSTINTQGTEPSLVPRIGCGAGAVTWVVDAEDHNVLLPIGVTGELLLEGPIVGRGYLNDPEKNATAFIIDPPWLLQGTEGNAGRRGRLYKTGDLVRYNEDGSLTFIGRKDTQVKIRGQRVELGEVEHRVQQCMPETCQLAAEVIVPNGEGVTAILAVFIVVDPLAGEEEPLAINKPSVAAKVIPIPSEVEAELAEHLPSYMVPDVFFSIAYLPITSTGKTDRKLLREIGASFSAQRLRELRATLVEKRRPTTETERKLQDLWARVLQIDPSTIGLDDHFFRLGGDSILAMRLVAECRRAGMTLSVNDIFRQPRLSNLSQFLLPIVDCRIQIVPPFSLLGPTTEVGTCCTEIASSYNLDTDSIQDVYPCTQLQEGLLALTFKSPGHYTLQNILELAPHVQLDAFYAAWEHTAQSIPILRTRLVQHSNRGLLQMVYKENIQWAKPDSVEGYLRKDKLNPMELGQPLTRYALICERKGQRRWMVWTIHHALYDGASLPLLLDTVYRSYHGLSLPPRPQFSSFVRYLSEQNQDAAMTYWQSIFSGYQAVPFPSLPIPLQEPIVNTVFKYECSLHIKESKVTVATLIWAAWSLVVYETTGSTDVVFGATISGRNAPLPGIEEIIGPTFATVPVRVQISTDRTVPAYLANIQECAIDMIPYQQTGVQQIAKVSEEARQATDFQTLFVVQPSDDSEDLHSHFGIWRENTDIGTFSTYALTLNCTHITDRLRVVVNFDSRVVESWKIQNMMNQFGHILQQLADAGPYQKLTDIGKLTVTDKKILWGWNDSVPATIEQCVHELVEEKARSQPNAPAVCAWDGDLTYGEVNELSNRLAHQLVQHGVGPGLVVPLCFEKSRWISVAILAVLKAGGAFVLLDPSQPESRLQSITQQIQAQLVLSSVQHHGLASRLAGNVIVVSPGYIALRSYTSHVALPSVSPSSTMYIVFTSGSTGTPKGVLIHHSAFSSATHYQSNYLKLSPTSRVLDFATYGFDVAISNILMTLIAGGCLCVPSDQSRRDNLTESMISMRVNTAHFTPSIARTLEPNDLPELLVLWIGGEAVQRDDVRDWLDHTAMINAYGPAECTPFSTINTQGTEPSLVPRIGRGAGAVTWVVDAEDHNVLLPIGVTGELLLEGPIVGQGYLKDPQKTALAFIKDPPWLLQGAAGRPGRHGRLYKTGDLVHYNEDGSLTFIGRKDTQVKIRGQRVELGEVEHRVQQCMPQTRQLAAEVIVPNGEGATGILAVFIVVDPLAGEEEPLAINKPSVAAKVIPIPSGVEAELAEHLPSYMVPDVFFSIAYLPITSTGKTDRKLLREIGASFSAQRLRELRATPVEKRQPTTETERKLQDLWARVLQIDPSTIGLDDHFFRLGGDSILAMRLVAECRRAGMALSVNDIFRQPKLAGLAQRLVIQNNPIEYLSPFLLLGDSVDARAYCQEISENYQLDSALIEDIYPCTPLQEGLLALTAKNAGGYMLRNVLELSANINISRFCNAWEQSVLSTPILRTRIVQHSKLGLLQVVYNEKPKWVKSGQLQEYTHHDKSISMGLGQPLVRYGLVHNKEKKQHWFIWTIHHALYDGESLSLILDMVHQVYHGLSIQQQPQFNLFVQHLLQKSTSTTTAYWQSLFSNYQSSSFPPLPPQIQEPIADMTLKYQCLLPTKQSDITTATLVRAAWALVASHHTSSPDVVFGATVSGRNATVAGIEEIVGPTIATVPIRVQIHRQQTVSAYLHKIQESAIDMIPYEQTGLQHISKISKEAQQACNFQTLLVIQPPDTLSVDDHFGSWSIDIDTRAFSTYALTLNCFLTRDIIEIVASFDARVIDVWVMQKVLENFSFIMQQLAEFRPDQMLSEINILTPTDRETLWGWNSSVPATIEQCVHELVEERARSQPNAPAVCAWDGDLTYGEVNELSNRLAHQLVQLGVGLGVIVPLCFEKSRWTSVAILAVLKAGGAFVLLDPSLPETRLQSILQQSKAMLVLSSITNYSLAACIADDIDTEPIVFSVDFTQLHPCTPNQCLPLVSPSSMMYVVFTSGSTGIPKGVMIPHMAFASAAHYQTRYLGLDPALRIFEFTAYSFDVAIANIMLTLITGGCLCVPSDQSRKDDLTGSLVSMKVNAAHFTPSVARTLKPSDLPELRVIWMSGEAVQRDDVRDWLDHTVIINAYGPAECTPFSTINTQGTEPSLVPRIGRGAGAVTWVVDAEDHNVLLPIGVTGELLLEGPIVGRGYLNDPEKNATAFIIDPPWLLQGTEGNAGRRGRLYKTGDLVRYNEDGSLTFIGRKDTQVKIRGQRVELGEVEHRVQQCMPETRQLAAEVIVPNGEGATGILAVFIVVGPRAGEEEPLAINKPSVAAKVIPIPSEVEAELAEYLPSYMVPDVFFSIAYLPITSTGKTDRKLLREIGASFSAQRLRELRATLVEKRRPTTETERKLQDLWARVLQIDHSTIGLDDHFFRLGGDSILAMRLVAECRRAGMTLSVNDIFRCPTLMALSTIALSYRG